jgi:type II secretory pathway component PulF
MEQAMKNAAQAEALQQQGIQADAKSPLAGFSNGKLPVTKGDKNFDMALASAIARGLTPENAINVATQSMKNLPKETPTPTVSLATGKNLDMLISSHNRVFDKVFGHALERGVPVDKAIEIAKRAESNSALPANDIIPPNTKLTSKNK